MRPTEAQLEALGRTVFVECGNGVPPFTISVLREPFDLPADWILVTIMDGNQKVQFHGGIAPNGHVHT